jgi:antitoxin ParD1/3/4
MISSIAEGRAMNVLLESDLEQYVLQIVRSGLYSSADDVVRAGLRLLQERDARLGELREAIALGIAEADRGELSPLDALATLDRVRARHAERSGKG